MLFYFMNESEQIQMMSLCFTRFSAGLPWRLLLFLSTCLITFFVIVYYPTVMHGTVYSYAAPFHIHSTALGAFTLQNHQKFPRPDQLGGNKNSSWINEITYFLPPPEHLCSASPTFILLVLSSPQNFAARQAIRETWGGLTNVNMSGSYRHVTLRVGFLLGRRYDVKLQYQIKAEHNLHGDIIQADYADSYKNITYKSVLALKFASEFCSNSSFMVKIDDDVFINPYKLADIAPYGKPKVIAAYVVYKAHVFRGGKWAVSKEELQADFYPDYASGPTYIASMDGVVLLYDLAMRTKFFVIDDVWVTGFLRKRAGIQLINSLRGKMNPMMGFVISLGCRVEQTLGYHGVSPPQQGAVWKYLQETRVSRVACPFR